MNNNHTPNEVYLQIIQGNINRLATVSFLIKGWSITLVAAIFALAAKDANINFILVAYFPSIMFWLLDGYFLGMERRFVKIYNAAANCEISNFIIKPSDYTDNKACMHAACLSRTLILFHGTILCTVLLVTFGISHM
ncbi:TPA: hypothetical protein ACGD2I_000490 [Aeromonas hydrophila]|uniref:hypothetical protein n=1 Tax=Aeromonas hydrophila TaxID=644 RepID=UPI00107ED5A9|nr:hypothetical protein [Aeromonas hydrophila]MCV3293980.1 hypothetical protein [Aeromonas hydrophila]QBX71775.1 hypothetical protein E4625_13640 [Aeromonas hydrophila]QBX76475.1 hypothetical protein E4630_13420 [Aeromonas hydrophila]WDA26802.1 hypothetical protein PSC74_10980 [Aeromonas hydrophila]WES92675.1 hypothetical protein PY368_19670 [Aeromonas hydrophila]